MKERSTLSRRSSGVIVLLVAVALLAVDQATKYFVLLYLRPQAAVTVISGLLEFSYVENTGAAFGLLKGHMWVVYLVTAIAFCCITAAVFRYRSHTFFSYAAAALILSGGMGNLIDRVSHGFVVDFIHVMFFDYVFNFADCCITVGSVLVVIHVLLMSIREKKAQNAEAAEENEKVQP